MKPPEYKDNYRESINEIITLNSRLTKLFKSLNVSSNFTITFKNLPKTYIDTLKNPVYLATEDYVLNQLSTAELGDLTKTVNFKNQEISFITQGPIQIQDNILNTLDQNGIKYLNISYLNDLTIEDIELDNNKYYLYYNSNENDTGYILYKYVNSNLIEIIPINNLICIIKENSLLIQYNNEQWINLNNYVFLDEIINDDDPNHHPDEVVFIDLGQNNYSLRKSIFDKYDDNNLSIYKWIDYFEYNNIKFNETNDTYYCIIKNDSTPNSSTTLYEYIKDTTIQDNWFWKYLDPEEYNSLNTIIKYVVVDKVINFSKGNIKSSEGLFDKITIGNPDLEGEFNVYYKDSNNNIVKNDIISKLKTFDENNENIKCISILVSNSNHTENPFKFNENDILYARYEPQNNPTIPPTIPTLDVSNININGLINVNKNAGTSASEIQLVNLNNILNNLQALSEQLTFIQSINADSNLQDIDSYANLRCNSIIVKNEENNYIFELTNKNEQQISDNYHMIIRNVIPTLEIVNQGPPSEYYNLFSDDSLITKKYFEGNQSTNITTPADIGTNDMPGRLNLYGVPDIGQPDGNALINLFFNKRDNTGIPIYTEFSMYGIETINVNSQSSESITSDDTFKINSMAVNKVQYQSLSEAVVSNVKSMEMKEILLKDIDNNDNTNNNDRMRIFYDKSSDTHTLNFNYKNLSSSSNNEKDLLQILYSNTSNTVELKAFGNISATNHIIADNTIITKSGFYVENSNNSQNIISLYKDNDNDVGVIKTDGLIIQDNLTNKELNVQSYDSNIELYTKKIDNNNNTKYNSYIKIKDNGIKITDDDNNIYYTGFIELNNYIYTDLNPPTTENDNSQTIPTIYLQNSQIQMNKVIENETTHKSINETVFSVDKNGKVKCTEIDLPGESSNIIVNSIIFKNKISNNEKNLFKITTQATENKSLIIYDIPDSDTPIKKVLQLEKTVPNLFETYTLKSYGFETFGTTDSITNSKSNLKIDNDGTIICKNILNEEYIFIYDNPSSNQNGIYHYENNQYIQDNDKNNYSIITSQNNEFNNNKGKLFIYNNTTWNNITCTFSNENPSSAPSSEEPNYWFNFNTKTFYKYDNNWSQITENIIICNRYDNIPQEKILNLQNNQIEMKLNNNTIFKVDSDGSIMTKSNINIENNGKFIMKNDNNNPFLQVNYENDFKNIETTKDINLYNGLTNNKFNEANKTISLSASGQITAHEIIINNNETSSLNDELNEDTQSKKYTKINNEFIQLYEEQNDQSKYINYGDYVFINNNDTKQLYKYDNNQYQQNNSYTYCICINHYHTYIYNSNEWDITIDIKFQRPNPANNGDLWFDKNENKLYVYNNNWGEYTTSSYIVCNEFSSLDELKQRINININSDGIIDSKSINIKDDINDNKIYVGKYINDTDDDTTKLIKIMYDENNKSYLEMYSDNESGRKQKLLIDNKNSEIKTNNDIIMNDAYNKLWLSIKKGNGITIQNTDNSTNTIYKNIINYNLLKISTKTGSEEEIEQIILTATGDITATGTITANEIHSTNYLTVDNNIYITKISNNSDEYIKFEVRRSGQQSLYAFLKLSTSDTPPSS